jgi:hypothetical protein
MGRSRQGQSKHDRKVQSLAENLERQGFTVKADVKGYEQPKTIGGVRPDIIASRPGERRIYEVETRDSVDTPRDQKQQAQFKKAADQNERTTFRRFMAD